MKKLFLYIFLLNLIVFSSNKVLAEDDFTATKEPAAYEQSSTTTFEYS